MKNKVIHLSRNQITPNSDEKYSQLLEQFMTPFAKDFINIKYIEDIFEFAINAWNMANINKIMPDDDIEEAMISIQPKDVNSLLLTKMIAYKQEKYASYNKFIVDFELKEPKAGKAPILSVLTQEEDAYLAAMANEIEAENSIFEDEYDENFINRSAIILKSQQPFIDWHNSLYPDSKIEETDVHIYLVDDRIDNLEEFLKKKYDNFFTRVLFDWHTNKKDWPQRRNYKMFKQWFRVQTSTDVFDLEKKPVLKTE